MKFEENIFETKFKFSKFVKGGFYTIEQLEEEIRESKKELESLEKETESLKKLKTR